MIYKKLVNAYMPFAQKQFGFNNIPKINYIEDEENSLNPIGNTGFYDPATMEISVYVTGRHPKDILRSVSHELVHHAQNCRGEFTPDVMGEAGEGYAQTSFTLRQKEIEANWKGNMGVRDFVDLGLYKENKQKGINKMIDLDALTDAIMSKLMEQKSCKCGKSHKGMTCEEYNKSQKDDSEVKESLNTWLNDERYNLLMKRFGVVAEKKKIKNPGPYIKGARTKAGVDDDGDGVPNKADKKPQDGSKK